MFNKEKNDSDEIILREKSEVANFVGTFYSQINKAKIPEINNETHKKVNRTVKKFKEQYATFTQNQTKFTSFTEQNPASNPTNQTVENFPFFTSTEETLKIFKKLNNKTSSGLDKIPNIVLKHLLPKIIQDLTIIFNNCLNNAYFPKQWEIQKPSHF